MNQSTEAGLATPPQRVSGQSPLEGRPVGERSTGELVIGAALLALAGIVAAAGRAHMKRATPPVPREAVESIKTDVDAIKESASKVSAHKERARR